MSSGLTCFSICLLKPQHHDGDGGGGDDGVTEILQMIHLPNVDAFHDFLGY